MLRKQENSLWLLRTRQREKDVPTHLQGEKWENCEIRSNKLREFLTSTQWATGQWDAAISCIALFVGLSVQKPSLATTIKESSLCMLLAQTDTYVVIDSNIVSLSCKHFTDEDLENRVLCPGSYLVKPACKHLQHSQTETFIKLPKPQLAFPSSSLSN